MNLRKKSPIPSPGFSHTFFPPRIHPIQDRSHDPPPPNERSCIRPWLSGRKPIQDTLGQKSVNTVEWGGGNLFKFLKINKIHFNIIDIYRIHKTLYHMVPTASRNHTRIVSRDEDNILDQICITQMSWSWSRIYTWFYQHIVLIYYIQELIFFN